MSANLNVKNDLWAERHFFQVVGTFCVETKKQQKKKVFLKMRYCEYFYKQIYCYIIDKQFLFILLFSVEKQTLFFLSVMLYKG